MDWLGIKEFIKDLIKLILFIVVLLVIMIYVFSVTQVLGNSMSPTLMDDEVLFLNKAQYRFFDIKRGDVVSLEYADTKFLIKRVIGLPGESLEIKNNQVYINGELLEEEYLEEDLEYPDFRLQDIGYETIPDDMYFVLGDNREDSMDSREIGLVSKGKIEGRIFMRFWPLNKIRFF